MTWLLFAAALLFLWALPRAAYACTTVLVGKGVSKTGEVLVGHNEDSGGRYVMRVHRVPERSGREGGVRFEPDAALLPLPEHRARLYWSEARPFVSDGGASFCDFYVNGNGVVICSDNCCDSREDRPELTDGGIGYGIRRLTAESARSAAHAVEIAASLLDRFGYRSSGRSYHFSDKDESWVLQAVKGKHYAVRRVPDDEVYLNPNHYTIRAPDPNAPGYAELIAHAKLRGWYEPERDGPFDFARAYQAPSSWRGERNVHRHMRGLEILLNSPFPADAELPFSVRPQREVGIETVKRILRTHFEGTDSDVSGGASPHFMRTRPICAGTTLESTIVQIRPDPDRIVIRHALGRPCLAPYVPLHLGAADDGALDPEQALATHFSVPAADLDWADTPWFRHTALQAAADLLHKERGAELRLAVKKIEDGLEREIEVFERGVFSPDEAAALAKRLDTTASDALKELYEGLDVLEAKASEVETGTRPFTLTFVGPGADLDLENASCGPHFSDRALWSWAIRTEAANGLLRVTFEGGAWREAPVPCLTDLWVLLTQRDGTRRAARALVRVLGAGNGTKGGKCACDDA